MDKKKELQTGVPQTEASEPISTETLVKVAHLLVLLQRQDEREELKRQEAIANGRPAAD